ncbi:MAG: hypothetical protein K6G16_06635 [Lachnospiraceae bacterium]|nr:hypothetical protein [Lachnospiraceae bacterium]
MDKYEYKLRADEIKTLIGEGRYAEAVQIADTIDWKKVKSVRMLCTISDVYKINRRYEESREILLIANNRYPDGRYIIYSLCELSIKLQDIVHAVEYFKEFVRIAPHNTSRYILQYKLYVAQDVSLEERIAVLQEFKKHDYREKWGYELAFLYHRVGLTTECVEECDELFLWFGGGRYVMKALELKALHEKLSPEQQKVYDRSKGGAAEAETDAETAETGTYDRDRDEMGHDESVSSQEPEDGEFHVKTFDVGQNNTINLQQVIAESLKELQKKPAPPVPQETRVMDRAREEKPEEKPLLESTADTGVLGITEEDLNAFEEESEGAETAKPEAEPEEVKEEEAPEKPEEDAFAQSLRHTAASIATDDTIWMPGIPEMARFAAEQGGMQSEISARTIAQATGELPMTEPVDRIREETPEDPVEQALQAPDSSGSADLPEESGQTPEKRLIDELQTEVGQARDEMRRIRAAERRAELKSRENNGGMREISSDTRRLGQTREYQPVARMDQAEEAALSDKPSDGKDLRPVVPAKKETGEITNARVRQVVRPSRATDEHGYDSLLAQSSDGQISMAVDERTELERQITGQLNINDYMTGWEDRKKDLQRRQMDGIRAHVKQNTDEIFKDYDEEKRNDLQHRLEAAQEEAIRREANGDTFPEIGEVLSDELTDEETPAEELREEEIKEADTSELSADDAASEKVSAKEESAEETPKRKPTKEEIAHQLAVLEGRVPPDAPAEALTSQADEQVLKNAEGEAAQPLPDADAVEEAMQPLPDETAEDGAETPADGEVGQPAVAPLEDTDADGKGDGSDEDDEPVLRVMTPEEKELFGPYIHRKRSRRQIVNAIDSLSMAAYTGNVIITGEEGAGTINLAKGLIRSIQLSDANFSGQIAKISGRAMNRKRVDAIVDKLAGGALIVQGAAGMNNETTKTLIKALQSENKGIVVVLEDTRKGVEKYLKKHPEITELFTVRVDVEALATRELVAYAKQYALDREFSMDEFSVLALHKRIDEMQTAEHEVTIAEVREIVDEAIHRATRKNPGHFFDILLQKRYDDDDMIILREKDFLR